MSITPLADEGWQVKVIFQQLIHVAAAQEAVKSDENSLDAFLILAGANAALNRKEEASKAASEIKRIKPDFTLQKYAETQPYKAPETLERVITMLQKAGLH